MADHREVSRSRVRLADLGVWVLGAALLAFVARRFWESWRNVYSGGRVPSWRDEEWIQIGIGLTVSAVVIAVGVRLRTQAVGVMRGRFDPIPTRWGVAVLWRLLAVGMLAGVEWVEILAVEPRPMSTARNAFGIWTFPVCGLLLVIGLLSGMKPPRPRSSRRPGSGVGAVLLAVLAGVGLTAAMMVLPHLVMVAIEGVFDAMVHPSSGRTPLASRIWWGAVPGGVALASCAVVGMGVSRILRRGMSGEVEVRRGEWVGLTVVLTAVTLAAIPAFFVTGLAVYQLRLIGPYGP